MRYAHAAELGPRTYQADMVAGTPDVWVVCDGVGGKYEAVEAAQMAAGTIVAGAPWPTPADALQAARDTLLEEWGDDAWFGGDTVAVVATRTADGYAVAWTGDCRAYAYTEAGLVQVTRDDNQGQLLRDAGHDIPADHYSNHVVLSTVRTGTIHTTTVTASRLMLCSDGLVKALTDQVIARGLRVFTDPGEAVRRLMLAASNHGLQDNTAVLVVDH